MGGPPAITPGGCTGGGGFSTTKLPAVSKFESARFKEKTFSGFSVCGRGLTLGLPGLHCIRCTTTTMILLQ